MLTYHSLSWIPISLSGLILLMGISVYVFNAYIRYLACDGGKPENIPRLEEQIRGSSWMMGYALLSLCATSILFISYS